MQQRVVARASRCRGAACRPPISAGPTRVGQALPPHFAGLEKTNERTGNVIENKGRLEGLARPAQRLWGHRLSRFVPSTQNFGHKALSLGDNGPRGRVREAGGPGDGLDIFPMDILSLILLIAARILSRLSVPPQSRRG